MKRSKKFRKISTLNLYYIFLINTTAERIIWTCPLIKPAHFWFFFFFFNLFLTKHSRNIFIVKIIHQICPIFLTYFNNKIFFRLIWSVKLYQNIFVFWYSHMTLNAKLWVCIIIFNIKINICTCYHQISIKRLLYDCRIIYAFCFRSFF